jgi:hypothetical protein
MDPSLALKKKKNDMYTHYALTKTTNKARGSSQWRRHVNRSA